MNVKRIIKTLAKTIVTVVGGIGFIFLLLYSPVFGLIFSITGSFGLVFMLYWIGS